MDFQPNFNKFSTIRKITFIIIRQEKGQIKTQHYVIRKAITQETGDKKRTQLHSV